MKKIILLISLGILLNVNITFNQGISIWCNCDSSNNRCSISIPTTAHNLQAAIEQANRTCRRCCTTHRLSVESPYYEKRCSGPHFERCNR